MGTITGIVPDELERRFREKAHKLFGGRGVISMALTDAIALWLETPNRKGTAIQVVCPDCGYKWNYSPKEGKNVVRLVCPACSKTFKVLLHSED